MRAEDRAQAGGVAGALEFDRAIDAVGVGAGERPVPPLGGGGGHRLGTGDADAEGEVGVDVQVYHERPRWFRVLFGPQTRMYSGTGTRQATDPSGPATPEGKETSVPRLTGSRCPLEYPCWLALHPPARQRSRSSSGKGQYHGARPASGDPAPLRPNHAPRLVVGSACRGLPRLHVVHRVFDVGRLPERALHVRPLSLAVLFAGAVRRFAARAPGTEARLVAGVAAVLAGADHPPVPRALPRHLLLLPRRVLQGVLGRSARVCRGRAARELPRRGERFP